MPKANLIIQNRFEFQDGDVIEIRVWKVPVSPDKPHGFKYSFVYISNGKRIIGYDNSEGKGNHRHYENEEEIYEFGGIDKLLEDFYNDVRRVRKDEN